MIQDDGDNNASVAPAGAALFGPTLATQRYQWIRGEDLPSLAFWLGLPADTPLRCLTPGTGMVVGGRSALFGIGAVPVVRMFWKPRRAIYVEIRAYRTSGVQGIIGGVHARTMGADLEWAEALLKHWVGYRPARGKQ